VRPPARSLAIRPQDEADLREARNWYEKKRAGLGAELLAEIGIKLELLAQDPERRPDYYRGFRRINGAALRERKLQAGSAHRNRQRL